MPGPRLSGKVACITGAGGGIGRATAERFVEEGAKVVVAEINVELGEAAAASARSKAGNGGGDAHFIHCDVTDKASVSKSSWRQVVRQQSCIDFSDFLGPVVVLDGIDG